MKKLILGAMMVAMGSFGAGCAANTEPTENDTVTVDSPTSYSQAELTARCWGPFASQIRKSGGLKVKIQVRFAGDGFVATCPSTRPCKEGELPFVLKDGSLSCEPQQPKPEEPVKPEEPADQPADAVAAPDLAGDVAIAVDAK